MARGALTPRTAARPRRPACPRRAGRELRGGAPGGRAGGTRRARRPRPRPPPGAARGLRGLLPRREGARVGARLRGPAAARPRPPQGRPARPGAGGLALPLAHGGRVPGHESAPVRDRRPALRGARGEGAVLRRRRVPVHLPLPPRGRARLPRAARAVVGRARADAELPLPARAPRGGQPPLLGRVRRRVPAARGGRGGRIVPEQDYAPAVLALGAGRRRYANMRKLARLARSYEELRGPDVEGFVRFVSEQEAVGARELEAVAEEEGADAVRLLTIHSAKGLEFKVVIVADAGRDRN